MVYTHWLSTAGVYILAYLWQQLAPDGYNLKKGVKVHKTLVEKLSCLFYSIILLEGKSREDRRLKKWLWIESDNSSWWDKSGKWKVGERLAQQAKNSTYSKALLQLLSSRHVCPCSHGRSTLGQVKDETKISSILLVKAAVTETGQMLN